MSKTSNSAAANAIAITHHGSDTVPENPLGRSTWDVSASHDAAASTTLSITTRRSAESGARSPTAPRP